jgi:putative intracellular protease/amidase
MYYLCLAVSAIQVKLPRYILENAPEIDVLLVPGGLGNSGEAATENIVQFVKARLESGPLQ